MGPRTLGRINATGLPGRRLCQGKPCFFPESLLPQWFRRDKRRQKQDKEPGDREEGSLAPFCAFPIFPPVSLARGGPGRGCLCRPRLTRAARVTWPGHVQPAPFLPQQLAHKQPGCGGGGGGDMCKRGGGARGPARAKGRLSAPHCLSPPHAGAASPQEIPSAPLLLLQNMFLGSDFQQGWSPWAILNDIEEIVSPTPTSAALALS